MLLKQVGPTCGFYCLEYTYAKKRNREINRRRLKKIIKKAIANKESHFGEIFDVTKMANLFNRSDDYVGLVAKVISIQNVDDLKKLNADFFIMPVKLKKLPHYIVVERTGEELRYYNPSTGKIRKITYEKLIEYNQAIKEKSFNWGNWIKKNSSKRAMLLSYLDNCITDRKYNTDMAKMIRQAKLSGYARYKEKKIANTERINMRGYCVVLEHTDLKAHGFNHCVLGK